MKNTITAGVITYSMLSARPVTKPPHGPIVLRANEYAPPVCGSAGDISASEKHSPKYIAATISDAMNKPPQPAEARPRFQPENWPEITAPTPSAHSDQSRAWRFRPRFSK